MASPANDHASASHKRWFQDVCGFEHARFFLEFVKKPPRWRAPLAAGTLYLKGTLYTLKGLEQKNAEKQTIAQKAPASRPRTVSHSTPIARSPHDL